MCDFICPECKSDHHSGCDTGYCTAVYYPPVYKNGVNVNPDRNVTTREITCLGCGKKFSVEEVGGERIKVEEVVKSGG